jgi:hypothetical protein
MRRSTILSLPLQSVFPVVMLESLCLVQLRLVSLCWLLLCWRLAECFYAKCPYPECHYFESRSTAFRGTLYLTYKSEEAGDERDDCSDPYDVSHQRNVRHSEEEFVARSSAIVDGKAVLTENLEVKSKRGTSRMLGFHFFIQFCLARQNNDLVLLDPFVRLVSFILFF